MVPTNALRVVSIALLACAALLVQGIPVHAIPAPIVPSPEYFEVGDAGDLSSPQFLTGGPYGVISGNIGNRIVIRTGSGNDAVDVFAFHWEGGAFSAISRLAEHEGIFYFPSVYSVHQDLLGRNVDVGGLAALRGFDLPADNYLIELALVSGSDPGYSITFSSPTSSAPISAPQGIPEPATIFLLGSGLAGLAGVAWRKRRPQ